MERIGPTDVARVLKCDLERLESPVKRFADDCVIYGKIMNYSDIDTLQIWTDWGSWR